MRLIGGGDDGCMMQLDLLKNITEAGRAQIQAPKSVGLNLKAFSAEMWRVSFIVQDQAPINALRN